METTNDCLKLSLELLSRTKILVYSSFGIFFFNNKLSKFLLFLKFILTDSFFSKCPLPLVTITINVAEFCCDAKKKHVDYVNGRFKSCTEYMDKLWIG
jgi:hypothetical protein